MWEYVYSNSTIRPTRRGPTSVPRLLPASYVGVVLLFRARARGVPAGIWLDGLTATLTAGAVGAAVLVEVVLDTTSGSLSTVATNLAYPLGDVFLLALVVGAFSVTRWRPGGAWLMIGAALTVAAIGDSVYLFQTAKGTYVEGTLLDVTWPTALLLMAWAGWLDRGRARPWTRPVAPFSRCPRSAPCSRWPCSYSTISGRSISSPSPSRPRHWPPWSVASCSHSGRTAGCWTARDWRRSRIRSRGSEIAVARGRSRAAVAVAEAERPWLLVIFDLDGFKGYNDSFGHPAGDQLLARLGHRLASREPNVDVYRLGGDEFCLLAPVEGVDIERLVDEAVNALTERGEGFEVTSSFGTVLLPEEATEQSEALRVADARLYAQKHGKRATREQPHRPLLQALLEREPALYAHMEDVAALASAIGTRLGLEQNALEELHRAALLHDIGKLAVPDAILSKQGQLDTDDWEFVRRHTLIGERILMVSPLLRSVGSIVRSTHERWDGTGYPDGLAGAAIPIAARVIAACDAWDAMTSDRTYRRALTADEALVELERCSGTQFDPAVVRALVGLVGARAVA